MKKTPIKLLVRRENETISLPTYSTEGSSGADIRANVENRVTLSPGSTAIIPTGLFFEIPEGYEIQVRPRSGLAAKHGITVLNTPGTIDSDYRGELLVIMINHSKQPFEVEPNMRVAQIVLAPVIQADFTLKDEELTTTARGEGKFGHTGLL